MKIYKLLILLLLPFACVKNIEMKQPTETAVPQYLEEIKVDQLDDEENIKKLQELQNITVDKYFISTGDKFNIFVYDEADLDTEGVIVKPDGTLSFKLIGEVEVEGLTIEEATAKIETMLAEYIHHPKVSLIPTQLTGANVTIMGKIRNPGTYEITSNMRVADIIAVSGGLSSGIFQNNTIELADLERSYIIRNNEILPVDFKALIREGDMLHNIPLIDGDYIYIPSSVNKEIYVLGEVGKPWHYLYKESMTLMQVITFSNGLAETATSEVAIIRGGLTHPRIFKIDINKILKGEAHDFPLKPNDIIYVPKSPIAKWNKLLGLIMPSLEAVQGGWMMNEMIKDTLGY